MHWFTAWAHGVANRSRVTVCETVAGLHVTLAIRSAMFSQLRLHKGAFCCGGSAMQHV